MQHHPVLLDLAEEDVNLHAAVLYIWYIAYLHVLSGLL